MLNRQDWRRERDGRTQSRPLFYWRPKEHRDWIFHIGGLFIRTYLEEFADLQMWHFTNGSRSENYAPGPIPAARIEPGNFIMLGALQPPEDVDIGWILGDFDRLLTLYQYVESESEEFPRLTRTRKGFKFSPGNKARAPRTKYTRKEFEVDKELRHNVLQAALFDHLVELHGKDNVGGEQDCGNGTPIDVCTINGKGYIYYELKTASTPRGWTCCPSGSGCR